MKSRTLLRTTPTRARSTSRPGQPVPHSEHVAHRSRGGARPGKRILLVDDDSTVRDSLNDVLLAEGYLIIPAEDGQQALDLANKSPVDLVLLDLNMPVKNGWDTLSGSLPSTRSFPSSSPPRARTNSSLRWAPAWVRSWKNRWTSRRSCERWKNFWLKPPSNASLAGRED